MCLGVPMTVVESDDMTALCDKGGARHRISMALVGAQPPGTHLLTHLGSAIRVMDEAEARAVSDALRGLEAALRGEAFEHRFADLIDREPLLPEHLRPAAERG